MRCRLTTWSSFQMPRHLGVILPSGVIAVASTVTTAAPPTAREPRWTKCQSVEYPSSEEYWHIGETTIRCGSVTPRIVRGANRGTAVSLAETAVAFCAVTDMLGFYSPYH